MARLFKDVQKADVGDVLAFLSEAAARGETAVVPAACLPLLSETAGCRPRRADSGEACYLFSPPDGARLRCGVFERAVAVAALVLLSPLLAAIACAIVLFDGWPVLFRQERFGKDGRAFTLLKFRTMLRRSELLQERLQKGGGTAEPFKLARDPRVTRTGGFLRRTFLDELPQFVNVARGEMRWVGPRPLPASDAGCYRRPCHALRLKGVPGVTGLWQVSGRNARTFDEMCLLDYYYVCNRSAALDARILGRTLALFLKQVVGRREA